MVRSFCKLDVLIFMKQYLTQSSLHIDIQCYANAVTIIINYYLSLKLRSSPMDLSVVMHVCNPSYLGGIGRRIKNSRPTQEKLLGFHLKLGE
jgi:hypothetical protein